MSALDRVRALFTTDPSPGAFDARRQLATRIDDLLVRVFTRLEDLPRPWDAPTPVQLELHGALTALLCRQLGEALVGLRTPQGRIPAAAADLAVLHFDAMDTWFERALEMEAAASADVPIGLPARLPGLSVDPLLVPAVMTAVEKFGRRLEPLLAMLGDTAKTAGDRRRIGAARAEQARADELRELARGLDPKDLVNTSREALGATYMAAQYASVPVLTQRQGTESFVAVPMVTLTPSRRFAWGSIAAAVAAGLLLASGGVLLKLYVLDFLPSPALPSTRSDIQIFGAVLLSTRYVQVSVPATWRAGVSTPNSITAAPPAGVTRILVKGGQAIKQYPSLQAWHDDVIAIVRNHVDGRARECATPRPRTVGGQAGEEFILCFHTNGAPTVDYYWIGFGPRKAAVGSDPGKVLDYFEAVSSPAAWSAITGDMAAIVDNVKWFSD